MRPTGIRRALRLIVAVAAAVGVMTGTSWLAGAPAQAHTSLVSTDPVDGSTVPVVPASVLLTFNEPAIALGTQVAVDGPGGAVQTGPPRLVDTTVQQDLLPGSPAGEYTVTWRVTSADGHPVSGSLRFTATAAGTGSAPPVPSQPPSAPAAHSHPSTDSWSAVWPLLAIAAVAAAAAGGVALWRRRRAG